MYFTSVDVLIIHVVSILHSIMNKPNPLDSLISSTTVAWLATVNEYEYELLFNHILLHSHS